MVQCSASERSVDDCVGSGIMVFESYLIYERLCSLRQPVSECRSRHLGPGCSWSQALKVHVVRERVSVL
jgi:hypothetical protein